MTHEKFYKDFGIRRIADFKDPKVILSKDITYPKNTLIVWYKTPDVAEMPNKDDNLLSRLSVPTIYTIVKYDTSTIGNFKSLTGQASKVINELKKKSPGFKVLKPNPSKVVIPSNKVLVVNYAVLNSLYKYVNNPLNQYYKWHNAFRTMTKSFSSPIETKIGRDIYIALNTPINIPNIATLDRFSKVISRQTLKVFTSDEHLTLLDLWIFLTPKGDSKSAWNDVPVENYKYINFMFSTTTGVSIINLGMLYAMLDTNDIKSTLGKYNPKMVKKLLYVYLLNIQEAPVKTMAELMSTDEDIEEELNVVDKETKSDVKVEVNENTKTIDIDEVIENEIIESDDEPTDDILDLEPELDGAIVRHESKLKEYVKEYETLDNLLEDSDNQHDRLVNRLNAMLENKQISKLEYEKNIERLTNQDEIESPYGNDVKLKDMLNITKEETAISKEEVALPDNVSVLDKTMLNDTNGVISKKYMKNTYKKHILSSVMALQNTDAIVTDYNINKVENILGGYEEHIVKVKALNGASSTINFRLPVVDEETGEFKLSGNKYTMRKQKADRPIRKISGTSVGLTSYYGKLFVEKASFKKDDLGFWFQKQFINKYDSDEKMTALILANLDMVDKSVPTLYGLLARYIRTFTYDGYVISFDYNNRDKLLKDVSKLEDIEDEYGYTLVGKYKDKPILMSPDGIMYKDTDSVYEELPPIEEMLDLDMSKAPIEFAVMSVYKKTIPLGILLAYYLGLDKLLKLLNTDYEVVKRTDRTKWANDKFELVFKDRKYIITKDYDKGDIILAGIRSLNKITKELEVSVMNNMDSYVVVFTNMGLTNTYVNEIKLLNEMFVDPITKNVLTRLKEPTTFKGLLVKSSIMLVDNNFKHPNKIDGVLLKGNERIAGMVYKEMVNSIRDYKSKNGFAKAKITMNPYGPWAAINSDSTVSIVDDLNPISDLKQKEDLTSLGAGGRSKESLNLATRIMHPSEIGVVSEASKDSGDVGVSVYLSANPKIKDTTGLSGEFSFEEDGFSSVLSTSALLAPASINDDVKRVNFIQIQQSHTIPIAKMQAPVVRTGYESVMAMRAGPKFVVIAERDGVVKKVDKKSISVIYKGDKEKVTKINIKNWTSKEEAGVCYEHKMVANLSTGDKFTKGDTIVYDSMFFEPDLFNPKKVLYKTGCDMMTALSEDTVTYEDSCSLSHKVTKALTTTTTKVKSFIVKNDNQIVNMVNVGDKLSPEDLLFTLNKSNFSTEGLSKESIEALQRIGNMSPKAKLLGEVQKIVLYYNCELSELSDTLKALAEKSDIQLIHDNNGNSNYTGKVDSSYSIQGRPLLHGDVEIKIYFNVKEVMGVADKLVLANQLKATVGDVYKYDVTTLDTNDEVEAIFSFKSIGARIVNSPSIMSTTTTLLEKVSKEMSKIYFD